MGTRLAHTPRSRCHPQMGRRHRLARPPPHKPPPKQLGLTLHQLFLSFNPFFALSLVACGAAGVTEVRRCSGRRVSTSTGISGAVSRRPLAFRAPCGCSYWSWPLCVPVGGGPPARLGDLLVAPGAALSSISHVIPLQLIQTLKPPRWNCNVFGRSQKMTVGNYVRNLSGPGSVTAHGTAAWPHGALCAGCCGLALLNLCLYARKSSPCGAISSRMRDKVRPVHSKHPKFSVFLRAGRTLSRKNY